MSIADVVIIVIIVLCALLALLYGTSKSIITLLSWAIAFFGALFLTRVIAGALIKTEVFKDLVFTKISGLVYPSAPASASAMPGGILGAILEPILKPVFSMGLTLESTQAADAAMIAYAIFSAAVMLVTFIVLRLLTMLFTFLMNKIFRRKGKHVSPVSRLLGFIVNGAKGLMFVFFIFIIGSFAFAIPQVDIVNKDIDKGFMGKPMFTVMAKLTPQMISGEKKMDAKVAEILELAGVQLDPAEEVSVTFDPNGGAPVPSPAEGFPGSTINAPDEPILDGFTFAGWYNNPEFTGDRIVFPYTLTNNDEVFYAKWDPDGGQTDEVSIFLMDGETAIDTITGQSGDSIVAPSEPNKDGFTFAGWYNNAEFTGASIEFPYTLTDADETFYAKWDPDGAGADTYYTVSYDLDGSLEEWPDEQDILEGTMLSEPISEPNKDGYEFAGWFMDTDRTVAAVFPLEITDDTVLYAKFDVAGLAEVESLLSIGDNGIVFDITGKTVGEIIESLRERNVSDDAEVILFLTVDRLYGIAEFAGSEIASAADMASFKLELESGGVVYDALAEMFNAFDTLLADIDANELTDLYDYTETAAYADFTAKYDDFMAATESYTPTVPDPGTVDPPLA